ncbi:radical SAM family heme chaperone HemW [Urbifossiella limnaea]|uniref:Heme chaperone HemW n=1 Tax=Urbifossiella limnaea TaxID=2528023 RepID=A0A517Y0A7_9BACT|nr:radical SAM family heme chaperone HemW [Urbifossiella limnaea]QDU23190.1 Oxygen-independent coproporphyrinogen-III oxidase-like protein [Urbifossiella limnaea]
MSDPWFHPRTAYVHVPFCAHHCGYCDFAVATGSDHLVELYLDALAVELAGLGEPFPVETRFIGGGTPTHLSADQLARLLALLNRWLPAPPGSEFSVEANPETFNAEKAAALAAGGVTRVSLGVQSFRPGSLAALERRHTPEQVPRAVDAVRGRGLALSLDLIFAAPGSTPADWAADLDAALAFAPDHVSTYGLTYETGTPLWKARRRGAVPAVPEDAELAMYEHAIDRLTAAGFEHYEVSNFARPGRRCRHNERYWANEAYHGFGTGAARYVGGRRELNVRDTVLYVRRVLAGESPTFQGEELPPRDRAFETLATQLRRADGIARGRFREQTGFALDELVRGRVAALVAAGLLADDGAAVTLTRRGLCVADGVVEDLLKANATG